MENDNTSTISLKGLVRRRRKAFLLTFLTLLVAAVVVAFALPPVYRSSSTILIEDQQIPEEYVKTTITSYVEERLQVINQQIMRRSKLLEIINQFNLYPELRDRYTTEEIIEKMREAIQLAPISAEVIDRRTGRPSTATIAFEISYEGKSTATVYRVANVLASLYLEENLKTREQQASDTTAFLQKELDEIKGQMGELEGRISRFKKRHFGALPEYSAINIQAIERMNRDLEGLNNQIRALQERKIYLEGQLATVDPVIRPPERTRLEPNDPRERLKALRIELIAVQARVSDLHPDVRRLQKEVAEIEAQVGELDDTELKVVRLKALEAEMNNLRGRYGPQHPDVVKLAKEIEAVQVEVRDADPAKAALMAVEAGEPPQENPAYINLRTQIASAVMEIASFAEEREQIKAKIAEYQKRIEQAPMVEREYLTLRRDHENAQRRYNDVTAKLMEARLSQGMEENQKGERFTIVDPAQQAEKPHEPNRLAIILIGFILALGAAVGIAAARESLDDSLKSPDELAGLTAIPVLSALPLVVTPEEKRGRLLGRILWLLLVIGVIGAALAVIHTKFIPLDILWIKIQRRLALTLPM